MGRARIGWAANGRAASRGAALAVLVGLGLGACGREEPPAAAPAAGGGEQQAAAVSSTELRALAVERAPLTDPADPLWERAPRLVVALLPQQIAYPRLAEPSVNQLEARALADPQWLSIRLSWADPSRDDVLATDRYTDAVAVELPLGDPARTSPFMGSAEHPVYILQWKAVWQRDLEHGRADVQDLHPGYWADPYPFVTGGHPYPVLEAYQTADARRYLPGVTAGNPASRLYRRWPVEELHAEGFGSLAAHRFQDARGGGGWAEGRWRVVLALPRHVPDRANPTLGPGESAIAFALWDGARANVGGRKHYFPFVKLVLP
ncbi:MAG: hypothetical protein KatS3mg102_2652 [Planctomycetota bacterium]|nr:MAG: hypothetical protein KatS3mg102_2652 [Planctomycetota bacterium]